jgi:malate synthase
VIFDKMSLTPDYPEFLTLPLYEAMEPSALSVGAV